MAITKRTELKEEILPNQVIQIRTTTVVEEDGVELARNHHRHVVVPGQDVTGEVQEVQDIAAALWTADVIAAYNASIADKRQRLARFTASRIVIYRHFGHKPSFFNLSVLCHSTGFVFQIIPNWLLHIWHIQPLLQYSYSTG